MPLGVCYAEFNTPDAACVIYLNLHVEHYVVHYVYLLHIIACRSIDGWMDGWMDRYVYVYTM